MVKILDDDSDDSDEHGQAKTGTSAASKGVEMCYCVVRM